MERDLVFEREAVTTVEEQMHIDGQFGGTQLQFWLHHWVFAVVSETHETAA